MKHLNSNKLCALAIKTTGPLADKHELLEIAIVPLTPTCEIDKTVIPFNTIFRPNYPQRAETSIDNDLMLRCVESGYDKCDAADLFDSWFVKLDLRERKRIVPLTHNWAATRPFILDWLQPTSFNNCFSDECRDPQTAGLFINDRADIRNERYPFPKTKLSYMCATQKVEYTSRLPTVIDECAALINLYKSLIFDKFF